METNKDELQPSSNLATGSENPNLPFSEVYKNIAAITNNDGQNNFQPFPINPTESNSSRPTSETYVAPEYKEKNDDDDDDHGYHSGGSMEDFNPLSKDPASSTSPLIVNESSYSEKTDKKNKKQKKNRRDQQAQKKEGEEIPHVFKSLTNYLTTYTPQRIPLHNIGKNIFLWEAFILTWLIIALFSEPGFAAFNSGEGLEAADLYARGQETKGYFDFSVFLKLPLPAKFAVVFVWVSSFINLYTDTRKSVDVGAARDLSERDPNTIVRLTKNIYRTYSKKNEATLLWEYGGRASINRTIKVTNFIKYAIAPVGYFGLGTAQGAGIVLFLMKYINPTNLFQEMLVKSLYASLIVTFSASGVYLYTALTHDNIEKHFLERWSKKNITLDKNESKLIKVALLVPRIVYALVAYITMGFSPVIRDVMTTASCIITYTIFSGLNLSEANIAVRFSISAISGLSTFLVTAVSRTLDWIEAFYPQLPKVPEKILQKIVETISVEASEKVSDSKISEIVANVLKSGLKQKIIDSQNVQGSSQQEENQPLLETFHSKPNFLQSKKSSENEDPYIAVNPQKVEEPDEADRLVYKRNQLENYAQEVGLYKKIYNLIMQQPNMQKVTLDWWMVARDFIISSGWALSGFGISRYLFNSSIEYQILSLTLSMLASFGSMTYGNFQNQQMKKVAKAFKEKSEYNQYDEKNKLNITQNILQSISIENENLIKLINFATNKKNSGKVNHIDRLWDYVTAMENKKIANLLLEGAFHDTTIFWKFSQSKLIGVVHELLYTTDENSALKANPKGFEVILGLFTKEEKSTHLLYLISRLFSVITGFGARSFFLGAFFYKIIHSLPKMLAIESLSNLNPIQILLLFASAIMFNAVTNAYFYGEKFEKLFLKSRLINQMWDVIKSIKEDPHPDSHHVTPKQKLEILNALPKFQTWVDFKNHLHPSEIVAMMAQEWDIRRGNAEPAGQGCRYTFGTYL